MQKCSRNLIISVLKHNPMTGIYFSWLHNPSVTIYIMWTSFDMLIISPLWILYSMSDPSLVIPSIYVCKSIWASVLVCPCNLARFLHQLVNCLPVWPASNESDSIADKREPQREITADWWKHWQPPPKMGAPANPTPHSQSLVFPANLHAGQNTCLLVHATLRLEDLRVSELRRQQTFASLTD